jgi:hypothetical protein
MTATTLRDVAHSRAGDKGNISNLSLIPYDRRHYAQLKELVTADKVREYFRGIAFGNVTRYELETMGSFNFVLEQALDGGNTRSLRPDAYGKSLSAYLLSMPVTLKNE